jgi:hypothetical protein
MHGTGCSGLVVCAVLSRRQSSFRQHRHPFLPVQVACPWILAGSITPRRNARKGGQACMAMVAMGWWCALTCQKSSQGLIKRAPPFRATSL